MPDRTTVITPSDTYVFAYFHNSTMIQLDTLMAMTISTDVDVKPVWNLGSRSADGYTFGPSIVAGTILFPKTLSMPFDKLLSMGKLDSFASKLSAAEFQEYTNEDVEIKPEYSVPFSILLLSSSEYGSSSTTKPIVNFKYIEGVKIVQTEEQMDQNSSTSIIVYKYTARNISDKTGYIIKDGKKLELKIPKRKLINSSIGYTARLYSSIFNKGGI